MFAQITPSAVYPIIAAANHVLMEIYDLVPGRFAVISSICCDASPPAMPSRTCAVICPNGQLFELGDYCLPCFCFLMASQHHCCIGAQWPEDLAFADFDYVKGSFKIIVFIGIAILTTFLQRCCIVDSRLIPGHSEVSLALMASQ
eukprot:scaffold91123_cov15-Tisochrysis_lutea.AAC.1